VPQGLARGQGWVHNYDLGQTYEQTGRSDEAIQEYQKAEELFGMSQDRLAELQKAYQQSGAKGYWRKSLELCKLGIRQPRKFASPSGFGHCDYMQLADAAAIEVRIGDYDAAFADLERAYTSHNAYILYLNADTHWNPIRSDPGFRDLTRRMGLAH
jgi:tetratricopeptide (TPR) repeat protein